VFIAYLCLSNLGYCDIQVVRQLDIKFGNNICKQDIVYTSCTKHKGIFVNYKFYKFS
jgi:hypothetical protein